MNTGMCEGWGVFDFSVLQDKKFLSSGGDYGRLRVYYSTVELDFLAEIREEDEDVFGFYLEPIPGKLEMPKARRRHNIYDHPDPLLVKTIDDAKIYITTRKTSLLVEW